jgi:putative acetyltransferase
MEPPSIALLEPDTPALLDAAREIFREYAGSLAVDLCFQGFEQELLSLPGGGAFRPLPDCDYANACEMKRLYVRRAFRRFGLGRLLAQTLMDRAAQAGHSAMLLDTLDEMESARGLYESLGFVEVPPYYFNPIPGAHYLKADL